MGGERILKFGSGEKSRLSCEITVRRDLTVGETDRHGFLPPPHINTPFLASKTRTKREKGAEKVLY
jgi:hypothetical protein